MKKKLNKTETSKLRKRRADVSRRLRVWLKNRIRSKTIIPLGACGQSDAGYPPELRALLTELSEIDTRLHDG